MSLFARTGGAVRRDVRWWRRHATVRRLDPWQVGIRGGTIHRRHVDKFKRRPRARASHGDPVCVVALSGGGYFAREGAHRITADREMGRRTRCLVVDEATEQGR